MNAYKDKSQRRASRIKRRFNASVEVGEKALSGIFRDFSEYGCFIQARRCWKKDTLVSIHLLINPTLQIQLQGKVVSSREMAPISIGEKSEGMGVEFIVKSDEYLHFVADMRK